MIKKYRLLFSIFIVGLLAACNQSIRSDVMRFHQLPSPSGEKIVIVPMNPNNNGSLEFASYATLVGNALGRYGYVPANGEEPDLIVELDYGISEGRQTIRQSPGMIGFMPYGGFYGGYHRPWFPYRNPYFWGGGLYPMGWGYGGLYDPFGYAPLSWQAGRVRTYMNYNRLLKMVIRPNSDNGQNLYEGEVKSLGRNSNLNEVMPYLVEAFFTNFPGESGSSERVSVELKDT